MQSGSYSEMRGLREFLDSLPVRPCIDKPSARFCTVCERLNQGVYQRCLQKDIEEREPVSVEERPEEIGAHVEEYKDVETSQGEMIEFVSVSAQPVAPRTAEIVFRPVEVEVVAEERKQETAPVQFELMEGSEPEVETPVPIPSKPRAKLKTKKKFTPKKMSAPMQEVASEPAPAPREEGSYPGPREAHFLSQLEDLHVETAPEEERPPPTPTSRPRPRPKPILSQTAKPRPLRPQPKPVIRAAQTPAPQPEPKTHPDTQTPPLGMSEPDTGKVSGDQLGLPAMDERPKENAPLPMRPVPKRTEPISVKPKRRRIMPKKNEPGQIITMVPDRGESPTQEPSREEAPPAEGDEGVITATPKPVPQRAKKGEDWVHMRPKSKEELLMKDGYKPKRKLKPMDKS